MTDDRTQSVKTAADVARLEQSIANLVERLSTAHSRIDKLERMIREDFKEIREGLHGIADTIQPIRDWMNRGKGWAAAMLLLASIFGAAIVKGMSMLMGK